MPRFLDLLCGVVVCLDQLSLHLLLLALHSPPVLSEQPGQHLGLVLFVDELKKRFLPIAVHAIGAGHDCRYFQEAQISRLQMLLCSHIDFMQFVEHLNDVLHLDLYLLPYFDFGPLDTGRHVRGEFRADAATGRVRFAQQLHGYRILILELRLLLFEPHEGLFELIHEVNLLLNLCIKICHIDRQIGGRILLHGALLLDLLAAGLVILVYLHLLSFVRQRLNIVHELFLEV